MLAVTADQGSAAIGTAAYQYAIAQIASGASTTFTTTYTGTYYIGLLVVATNITIAATSASVATALGGIAPIRIATGDTGQTSPPSFPHTTAITAAVARMGYMWAS